MQLVERDEALVAFEQAVRDAAAGRGRVVVVRGEPGIGKTVLVRHALATLADGARVLLATCDDLATARPLGPLRDLGDQLGDELGARLRRGAAADDLFDLVLDELGRSRPTVLAVDDVQWADEATLDVLSFLVRRLDRLGVLVVLAHRSGLEPDHPLRAVLGRVPASAAVHLDLAPLSPEAVARLADVPDPRGLWRRTGGNPFLVSALVRHGAGGVPPTVQDAVLGELADLEPEERGLVELVAVVPTHVESVVLDACRPGWEAHGTRPELRGLLELDAQALRFRHDIARQAVLESLPSARRRQLHRDVLEALRDGEADPALLVHHAVGADDVATLLEAGPVAARAAAAAGAHRQALQHYERLVPHADAMSLAQRAALWDDYASELMTADDPVASRRAWERARDLSAQVGNRPGQARALGFLAGLATVLHDPQLGEDLLAQALVLLEDLPEPVPELASTYVALSGRHMAQWEFDAAITWARRALAVAEPAGFDVPAAYALVMLGTTLVTRGDVDEGLQALDRGIDLARRVGAHNLVSLGTGNACESLLDVARPDLAAGYLEHARGAVDRHETLAVGGYVAGVHARLHAVRAEWDPAAEAAATVWDGGPVETVNQVVAALALARVWVRRGERTEEAIAVLDEVRARRWELQYCGPAAALLAEQAFLAGGPPPAALADGLAAARACGQGWLLGELAVWAHRFGQLDEPPADLPEPHLRLLEGDPIGASAAWHVRGHPYEALLVLVDSDDPDTVRDAVARADLLGAPPLADRLRDRLRELGIRHIPRGPQPTTRENPAGLTDRQLEVLRHVLAGRTNTEIAAALVLSVRTVDHHVSATLGKLGVASRHEAAELAAELGILPAG